MIATANNSQLYLAREAAFGSGVAVGTPVRLASVSASWQPSYSENDRGGMNRFGFTRTRKMIQVTGSFFKELRLSDVDESLLEGVFQADEGFYAQRMLTKAPSFVLWVEQGDGVFQKASGVVIEALIYSSRPKEPMALECRFKASRLETSDTRQLPDGVFTEETGETLSHIDCTLISSSGDRAFTDYNCTITTQKTFRFQRNVAVGFSEAPLTVSLSYSEYLADVSAVEAQLDSEEQRITWEVTNGEKTLTLGFYGYAAIGNEPLKTDGDAVRQVDIQVNSIAAVSLIPVD